MALSDRLAAKRKTGLLSERLAAKAPKIRPEPELETLIREEVARIPERPPVEAPPIERPTIAEPVTRPPMMARPPAITPPVTPRIEEPPIAEPVERPPVIGRPPAIAPTPEPTRPEIITDPQVLTQRRLAQLGRAPMPTIAPTPRPPEEEVTRERLAEIGRPTAVRPIARPEELIPETPVEAGLALLTARTMGFVMRAVRDGTIRGGSDRVESPIVGSWTICSSPKYG